MKIDNETKSNFIEGLNLMKQYLLDNYVSKENSLNTRPQDYKGENAKDESLPSDWVNKLKPLSGGPDGGKEGDSGPERKATSSGSQGTDPYIHKMDEIYAFMKQMSEQMGGMPTQPMSMAGDEMPEEENGGGDEMMWDTEDAGSEEMGAEGVDDMMGAGPEMGMEEGMDKMGHGDQFSMGGEGDGMDSEMLDALNQIKGILSQVDFQKQATSEVQETVQETVQKALTSQFAAIKKEMQKSNANNAQQVNKTVQQILKSQGLAPMVNENPVRIENTVVSKAEAAPNAIPDDFKASESIQKAEDTIGDIQKSFVGQVNSIVDRFGKDDLLGCFKFTNSMRMQNGEGDLTHPLYYYEDVVR